MIDPDTGCTEEEMNDTDWQQLWEEEALWREMEDAQAAQQEMEKARE